ncbi:MAG: polar amino acid transport system permease protein [Desulfonauticus sp.]|jgi:polar amino acid transport system permease protein|nr:polar amino acid transport system permease protein [Desulfonauticus sp.]
MVLKFNHKNKGNLFLKPIELVKLFLFLGLFFLLAYFSLNNLTYHWQWYRIPQFFGTFEAGDFIPGPFLKGLVVTLKITLLSLIFTLFFGFCTAFLRLSSSFTANFIAKVYLESIRNTPLLIQILFNYFVLAPIFELSAFTVAVLSLSLFEGAYASEIIRAAILSVPKEQWEAALSTGLNTRQAYLYVIFPQSLLLLIPPLTSQIVSLLKDSSLVSVIALYDLTMQGQVVVSNTFLTFEVWFTIAGIYLTLALAIVFVVHILEKKQTKFKLSLDRR